jgi:hypothetical protein
MALAFNPFSKEEIDRRTQEQQARQQASVFSQVPAGTVPPPVANPQPQFSPITSLPNQLNIDESLAVPINEDFRDWYVNRAEQGLGGIPVPTPFLNYQQERDPTTGDYISRNLTGDFAGVPPEVAALQRMYLEPQIGRLNASMAGENAARAEVRAASEPQQYTSNRLVNTFDPMTGRSVYQLAPTTQLKPFLPLSSQFTG